VIHGDAGGLDGEGVERLSLDHLQVVERCEADGDVGDVRSGADLGRDEAFDPVLGALADHLARIPHEGIVGPAGRDERRDGREQSRLIDAVAEPEEVVQPLMLAS
jgi:hypothetical protein